MLSVFSELFHMCYRGWLGEAKVSCILRHRGVQLIFAYSWARPAVLAAGKGRRGNVLLSPAFSKKSEGTWYLAFRGAWCVVPSLK